jgi:hypothetical protein
MTEAGLPRLLYIGDVPVESTLHGSAGLYRLLQGYPPKKLLVVEQAQQPSLAERRLPTVRYERLSNRALRLLSTRFAELASSWLILSAGWRIQKVQKCILDFQPEAVLTVAHGYSWLTAAAFARRNNLPLHLIVHDPWPEMTGAWGFGLSWRFRRFGTVYRQAASQLCVSPSMVETYRSRYGVEGVLLYPYLAAEEKAEPSITQGTSPKSETTAPRALTGAYAGSVWGQDYYDALAELARQLDRVGGKLLLFGNIEKSMARMRGLTMSNVEFRGMLPSSSCLISCRQEADFLFVPMSFASGDRPKMELCFPSKLTDYSAMNLPILIRGPVYCSAIRWARENSGVAIVVDSESKESLFAAIVALSSAETRKNLATRANSIGKAYFSHARAQKLFFDALKRPTNLAAN